MSSDPSSLEKPKSPLAEPSPWNMVAAGYDTYTRDFLGKYSSWALQQISLPETAQIVDVACGPGTTSLLLADRVSHIDAVDFSAQMLEKFRRHLQVQGASNVTLHEADGQNLPLRDSVYDLGISMFGLMFFPDRVQGMRELFRVLQPGGQVVIGSWASAARSELMSLLFETVRLIEPAIPGPVEDIKSLENPAVLKAELEEAGFVDVHVQECSQAMEIDDIDEFWTALHEGSVPVLMLRKKLGEEEWRTREVRALEHLRARVPVPSERASAANIGFGRKPNA